MQPGSPTIQDMVSLRYSHIPCHSEAGFIGEESALLTAA